MEEIKKEFKLKFDAIRPFGPTVIKGKLPPFIIDLVNEKSDEFKNVLESYVSSFYVEKMYRSNRFFNEKFIIVYTQTGLIRNVWSDLYYTDDDLITH